MPLPIGTPLRQLSVFSKFQGDRIPIRQILEQICAVLSVSFEHSREPQTS